MGLLQGQQRILQHSPRVHLGDGGVCQVGVDRVGPVADQQAEVHHFARLAGLDHDAHLAALGLADEVVVHGGAGEQRRDRSVTLVHAAVGQDEHSGPGVSRCLRLRAKAVERDAQAARAFGNGEGRGKRLGSEANFGPQVAQLLELGIVDDRQRHSDHVRVLGPLGQHVALGPHIGEGRHDQFLADRVDRGVGHLGEQLLEVAEEQLRALRQAGQRDVNAHRPSRLGALRGHRREQDALVLEGVAEAALALEQCLGVGLLDRRGFGQLGDVDQVLPQPVSVGLPLRNRFLDLLVADDAALLHVHQEHPARLQAALGAHVGRVDAADNAGLRAHHHQVVFRDAVARRAQPIAVERAAYETPVREHDRGRAVPGLHHRGVVFVELLLVGLHVLVGRPRFGNEHHEGVRNRAP